MNVLRFAFLWVLVAMGFAFAAEPIFVSGSASAPDVFVVHDDDKDDDKPDDLDPSIATKLDEIIDDARDPRSIDQELWRACMVRYGHVDRLMTEIDARLAVEQVEKATRLDLIRIKARLLRRLGDSRKAKDALEKIETVDESVNDCLAKAEVLDVLGEDEAALAAYDRLLKKPLDAALKNRILLRQALMRKPEKAETAKTETDARVAAVMAQLQTLNVGGGSISIGLSGLDLEEETEGDDEAEDEKPSPLAEFALADGRAADLKNQAAVVLALRNEQKHAIKLFEVSGTGSKRYRQEVRLAEWAIEAEKWEEAQEFAWKAVKTAKLKRDRRYALTILVEAYRRPEKLEELSKRFADEKDLDAESRQVWIDLLRETGQIDEALRLFRESVDGQFTVDMRRELLEMCRETGQENILVDAYSDMIKAEPRFIEWREGLARYYLERGNREEAEAIWRPYLDVTDETRYRMAAAATMMGLGLDDLAVHFARECMKSDPQARDRALLFQYELHLERGRQPKAAEVLDELDRLAEPTAGVRKEVAEAYARLGNKKRAMEILESFCKEKGDAANPDTQMKLAFMLSEVGKEEEALELWQKLWRRTTSIPRRRYVEDRMMTVASRLGRLAKIAVRLEKKLAEGTADDLDAGLLVRLYTKVKDAVSATEIIEEHMTKSGKKPIEVLTEKARVFLSCNDYYNYEEVIRELIEVDEEGRPDYLRQLAMSNLERGQRDEAREILERLKKEDADTASDEFEAGVLALAGLREEALQAYRRGIARSPDRIDTYLLLSNVQKELGRHDRSAGMFQYLATTAPKDDLFIIAIDGLLNMRDGRANRGAPNRIIEWARRVVLERLAQRPNKLYLYQLVADLSDELNDKGMGIRAMKAALPIAGEQRTPLLRELMAMAKGGNNSNNAGMIIIGLPGNAQPIKDKKNTEELMFGRRLLGQRELVPPQVYLDLGASFLAAGEVANATKTFNQAGKLPEFAELQERIAQAFEKAAYPREALRVYERILSVESSDVGLMTKVGELQEQLGRDDFALDLYRRGLELLLDRSPFATDTAKTTKRDENPFGPGVFVFGGPGSRNTDPFDTHYKWQLLGLLATLPTEQVEEWLTGQEKKIDADLATIAADADIAKKEAKDRTLAHFPRLERRARLYRRVATVYRRIDLADRVDERLLTAFTDDEGIFERFARHRLDWGYVASARGLIEGSDRPEEQKRKLRLLAGGAGSVDVPGVISIAEAASLVLPLLADGRQETAKTLLERIDLSTGEKDDIAHMRVLVGATVYLDEAELALGLGRHWLNLLVKHSAGTMYGAVEGLLQQCRTALDKKQTQSLVEYLVDKIVEKPDKFSGFIRQLPELQKSMGGELLTTEQVEKLIVGRLESNDNFIYGIPDMFALLDAADRGPILRKVWGKVVKSQQAMFLIYLLPHLDERVDAGFGDFLLGAFEAGLKETKDITQLRYWVDNIVESKTDNMELVLGFIDRLLEKNDKDAAYRSARAMCLHKLERKDEAGKAAEEAYFSLLGADSKDWQAQNAVNRLVEAFRKDHLESLLAAITRYEKENGDSAEMASKRLNLLDRKKEPNRYEKELRAAITKYPKNKALRGRLKSFLQFERGSTVAALKVQEEIVEENPKSKSERNRLVGMWRGLRHPVNALLVREAGKKHEKKKKEKKEDEAHEQHKKERTPPATVAGIQKALEKDERDAAQVMFRRVWRIFPDRSQQYFQYGYQSAKSQRQFWPKPKKKAEEKKKADDEAEKKKKQKKRHRGGLPAVFFEKKKEEKKAEEKKPKKDDPNKRKTAQEVLVKEDFGRREIDRQLRSFDYFELDNAVANDILDALTKLELETTGKDAAIDKLLAREKAGMAGKIEYGRLFALLEDLPKEKAGELESTLGGLMKNIKAGDSSQLRRLARLYVRSGNSRKAAALYRWCAVMEQRSRFYFNGPSGPSLLDEVIENLEGDDRDEIVEAVLASSEPAPDNYWGRDGYYMLVLRTWEKLRGQEGAAEKALEFFDKITALDIQPNRQSARLAARILAQSGHHEKAIRCLEIGTCKLEAPASLPYTWLRGNFERAGWINQNDVAKLLPLERGKWTEPVAWFRLVGKSIKTWAAKDRVRENVAFQFMVVAALRLKETDDTELATELITVARERAGKSPSNQLWIADVYRLGGDDDAAASIERKLFDEKRLHIERVPEVVARVLEKDGAEAALTLGETAAEYTLHEDLVEHLLVAAEKAGREDRLSHWQGMKKARVEALEALKPKKKDEKAKGP